MRAGIRPGACVRQRAAAAFGVLSLHTALLGPWAWPQPQPQPQLSLTDPDRLVVRIPIALLAVPKAPQQKRQAKSIEGASKEPHNARSPEPPEPLPPKPIAMASRGGPYPEAPNEQQAALTNTPAAATPSAESPSTSAQYLYSPPPPYPSISRHRGEQGRVIVSALVSIEGLVKQAFVEVSSGFPRLDEAALAAVLGWRFVPAQRAGVIVETRHQIPVRFELDVALTH